MGGIFSSNNPHSPTTLLIPGLPNDLSLRILARVPRVYYLRLKLVSRSWLQALCTRALYNLRRQLETTEELLFILCRAEDNLFCYAFDPVSRIWQKLPPLPQDDSRRGLAVLSNHNSLGSRIKNAEAFDKIPFRGCSIAVVNGCLYIVGGFSRRMFLRCGQGYLYALGHISRTMTLRCVWRYDPLLNVWNEVRPMLNRRAYSMTQVVNNKLYVVGGVRADPGKFIPVLSAEVYDPETDEWSEIPSIPCSQVTPTGLNHISVNPAATDLILYKSKPILFVGGGKIYDPESRQWVEIPIVKCDGWPDMKGGNRMSVVVGGDMYALDMLYWSCVDRVTIKVYDKNNESWKVFSEEVPRPFSLIKDEFPYLLAGFGGKLHVIIKDAYTNFAVFEACTRTPRSSHSNSSSSRSSSNQSSVTCSSSQVRWKLIASMRAGYDQLVCCQILRI